MQVVIQILKNIVHRLLVLPVMLIGWIIALVIRAMWGRDLSWHSGVLVVRLAPDSWPLNPSKKHGGWYAKWAGTSFGHGIMLHDTASDVALRHELRHTKQTDSNTVAGLLLAIPVAFESWWMAAIVWVTMPICAYVGAMLIAWLRGEDPYRGNHLEEAAYAAEREHGIIDA